MLWEGRRARAKTFYIAGDLNAELGLLCTDDDDIEELNEMFGPLCWEGCENDQGGFKKLMTAVIHPHRALSPKLHE